MYKENNVLKQQLENCRVLVEITNTVLAKRDIKELASKLSEDIKNFFEVNYISLDLIDGENSHINCYTNDYSENNKLDSRYSEQPLFSPTLISTIKNKKPYILYRAKLGEMTSNDHYLSDLFSINTPLFCLIPLIYNDKVLGVLTLGGNHSTVFSDGCVSLLQQIAARISISIDHALAYQQISQLKDSLQTENQYLTEEIRSFENFDEIIGQSEAMSRVLEQVKMVADSDCTVLILGETGTGKELVARAIHNLSARHKKNMVKVNCAAIPSGLLESELFGHEKGAFTGATTPRLGKFELANNSSLLLDEVGDIPLELQPKLLRVLQEREIERLGSNKILPVNVRIIAATNCDLAEMVNAKAFRSDLFYRLNVFPILIPPLRERREDIPLLVEFLTHKIARRMNRKIEFIPSEAVAYLKTLPWLGNVRELENIIERAVILTKGNKLNLQVSDTFGHLSSFESSSINSIKRDKPKKRIKLDDDNEIERQNILRALKETNGIVAGPRGAAEKLGLKRTTLLSRMQRLGISVQDIDFDELDEM